MGTPKAVILFAAAAVAILGSEAAVLRREKRSLGLVKSAAAAAVTAAKIGAGVAVAKPLALGLLGKYALYKWVTSGSNAGITADAGLGPLQFKESLGYEYGAPQDAAVGGRLQLLEKFGMSLLMHQQKQMRLLQLLLMRGPGFLLGLKEELFWSLFMLRTLLLLLL